MFGSSNQMKSRNERAIVVIKKNAEVPLEQESPEPEKTEAEMERTMKDWITERRENSQAEMETATSNFHDWNATTSGD